MRRELMRLVALLGSGILSGCLIVFLLLYFYRGAGTVGPEEALLSPKIQGKVTSMEWVERGKEARAISLEEYEALYKRLLASKPLPEAPPQFQIGTTVHLLPVQTIQIDQGGEIWRVESFQRDWHYFSMPRAK